MTNFPRQAQSENLEATVKLELDLTEAQLKVRNSPELHN